MEVRIGEIGRITNGDKAGSFVKVVDDAANTGGYLILTSAAANMAEALDDWVEDKANLDSYFREAGWIIEWPEVHSN